MTPEKLREWLVGIEKDFAWSIGKRDMEALAQLHAMLDAQGKPSQVVGTDHGTHIHVDRIEEPQRFPVDDKMLTRAEILKLPIEKRREILGDMADTASATQPDIRFCGACGTAVGTMGDGPFPLKEPSERRKGHSKLVYDKRTRTIVSVDPHPKEPA